MKSKIARTKRLAKFENQIVQKIQQEALALSASIARINEAIAKLYQEVQDGNLAICSAVDPVGQRSMVIQRNESLRLKIAKLDADKLELETQFQRIREELVEQKVKAEVMDKLLADQKLDFERQLEERRNLELLEIANRKFLESSV